MRNYKNENYVFSFLRFSPKMKQKRAYLYKTFFLIYQSPIHSQILTFKFQTFCIHILKTLSMNYQCDFDLLNKIPLLNLFNFFKNNFYNHILKEDWLNMAEYGWILAEYIVFLFVCIQFLVVLAIEILYWHCGHTDIS